mmetsp:Transcript_50006/g.157476  ORF Transcript_50006/g.157476 Transcript_50006/m.157476 type:complete len:404 (-) Transcript_50006:578-1789(-)
MVGQDAHPPTFHGDRRRCGLLFGSRRAALTWTGVRPALHGIGRDPPRRPLGPGAEARLPRELRQHGLVQPGKELHEARNCGGALQVRGDPVSQAALDVAELPPRTPQRDVLQLQGADLGEAGREQQRELQRPPRSQAEAEVHAASSQLIGHGFNGIRKCLYCCSNQLIMTSELLVDPPGGDGHAALAPHQDVLFSDRGQLRVQRDQLQRVPVRAQEAAVRVVALQGLHELFPRKLLLLAGRRLVSETHRHLVVTEHERQLEPEDQLLEVAAQLLDITGVPRQAHSALALPLPAPLPVLVQLHNPGEWPGGSHNPGVPQAAVQGQAVVRPLLEETPHEVPGVLRELAVAPEAQLRRRPAVREGVRALQHEVEQHAEAPQVHALVVPCGAGVRDLGRPELGRAHL